MPFFLACLLVAGSLPQLLGTDDATFRLTYLILGLGLMNLLSTLMLFHLVVKVVEATIEGVRTLKDRGARA
jgi:hypothetical protein